jgi:geranylgeranyl diphosphate synthase type II
MLLYNELLCSEIENALDHATQFNADCPERLKNAIRYSLLAPGKRLRPILVLTANELCGGKRCEAIPAACAIEMVHCYSLIHDDLPAMDNDDLRRGRATCHKQFDEATAILAGDALLPLAFEVLSGQTFAETNDTANSEPNKCANPNERTHRCLVKCIQELAVATGARQLVGGQSDDVMYEKGITPLDETLDSLKRIHSRKTGALIRVSLKLGGLLAGASETQLTALDHYGHHFGLAFQITDDLLDVLGEEKTVG